MRTKPTKKKSAVVESDIESDDHGGGPTVTIRAAALRCPFCHDHVNAEKPWIACAGCLARHHKACWRDNKKCASCGGKKALVPEKKAPRVPGAERVLGHEAHIRAIAFWEILTGALIALIGVFSMLAGTQHGALLIVGFVTFGLGAGFVGAGRSLWRYENAGRVASIILNIIGILLSLASLLDGNAVSSSLAIVMSMAELYVLLTGPAERIFSAAYRAVVAREPHVRPTWTKSPFFWVPCAIFVAEILIGIASVTR